VGSQFSKWPISTSIVAIPQDEPVFEAAHWPAAKRWSTEGAGDAHFGLFRKCVETEGKLSDEELGSLEAGMFLEIIGM
jgi:hypothetical protein